MTAWDQIQTSIRSEMSGESYRNWLEPVRLSHVDGEGTMHLLAPNADVRRWLESEFSPTILATARALGLGVRSVDFKTEAPEPALAQQAFDFKAPRQAFNARYTFERFVVGSCNELSHAAAQAVAAQPAAAYNPLYMYSSVGLGKTHLLHAIGNRLQDLRPALRVVYSPAEEFMNEMIKSIRDNTMPSFHERYRRADVLLVDDVQVLSAKERTQAEFFHTFNALHNNGKQIVLCSDSHPDSIHGLVDRLKSRFRGGLMTDIQPPDLETKMAILDRKADEVGVALPSLVRGHIAARLTSNVRDLEGLLNRLIARAQFIKSPITLGMVQSMFGTADPQPKSGPDIPGIQQAVALEFGFGVEELRARNNSAPLVRTRQVAMYLCKHLTQASLAKIGKAFRRHHTTVLHAAQKIEQEMEQDNDLKATVKSIRDKLQFSGYSHSSYR